MSCSSGLRYVDLLLLMVAVVTCSIGVLSMWALCQLEGGEQIQSGLNWFKSAVLEKDTRESYPPQYPPDCSGAALNRHATTKTKHHLQL